METASRLLEPFRAVNFARLKQSASPIDDILTNLWDFRYFTNQRTNLIVTAGF